MGKHLLQQLIVRRLWVKVAYELKREMELEQAISSFRAYLSEQAKAMPAQNMESNRRFLCFAYTLCLSLSNLQVDGSNLCQEIEATPYIDLPEKRWLLEKAEVLAMSEALLVMSNEEG